MEHKFFVGQRVYNRFLESRGFIVDITPNGDYVFNEDNCNYTRVFSEECFDEVPDFSLDEIRPLDFEDIEDEIPEANEVLKKAFEKHKFLVAEKVVHPKHYNKGIECWDFIISHNMDFLTGNVIKYLTRHKDKNGIEDLNKAKQYLEKLIEVEEKKLEAEQDQNII